MPLITIMAAAADDAAQHAADSSSGGLPQMDFSTYPSQFFWLAISFGVLYWIMSTMILPRLGGAIEERRDRIADDLDQAAEFRRQAEEAEASYNKALADARAKAQGIAAETRGQVEAEIAAMQVEADEKANADIAAAEAKFSEMRDSASVKVRDAAGDVAKSIVAVLIEETPADDAVRAAVEKSTSP